MSVARDVAHLYRRLGFGATLEEIREGERIGVRAAAEKLINYDEAASSYPISPWSFCMEEGKQEIYLDSVRPALAWSLRIALTKQPLQEKLTLFWHDHFAVSGAKVEIGPMLQSYVDVLRDHAAGPFAELLQKVSQEPAMCFWLDVQESLKGRPNENFAREVMELFTVGMGHYTEQDIREAARSFTGWGIRYLLFEKGGEHIQEVARASIENDQPMFAFSVSPALHDASAKTLFGKTANWSGEEVLEFLADRPETALHLSKKLWEFFAYPNPEPEILEALATKFRTSKGSIREVVRSIVNHPAFWSEKARRAQVKSPIDFVAAIVRQLGVAEFLLSAHGPKPQPLKPLPKPLLDVAGAVFGLSAQQGMQLLFPPDVAGWDWGSAWITSANMTQRMQMAQLLLGTEDHAVASVIQNRVSSLGSPTSSDDLVSKLLLIFDAEIPEPKKKLLIEAADAQGGIGALASPDTSARLLLAILKPLFGTPEFQFM